MKRFMPLVAVAMAVLCLTPATAKKAKKEKAPKAPAAAPAPAAPAAPAAKTFTEEEVMAMEDVAPAWNAMDYKGEAPSDSRLAVPVEFGIVSVPTDNTGNTIKWKGATTVGGESLKAAVQLPWDTKTAGDCIIVKAPAGTKALALWTKNGSSGKSSYLTVAVPSKEFKGQTAKSGPGVPKVLGIEIPELTEETEVRIAVEGTSDDEVGGMNIYRISFKK